jgi:hypothetical protein
MIVPFGMEKSSTPPEATTVQPEELSVVVTRRAPPAPSLLTTTNVCPVEGTCEPVSTRFAPLRLTRPATLSCV